MSHFKLRKENNCLNCGAEVLGRYCHLCGQENIEPKETFWNLVTHFFYDITHFDGKFFSSVKYLLIRPGFLSLEYLKGKRMTYLNPIKMYVFTSAFFFFILFILASSHLNFDKPEKEITVAEMRKSLLEDLKKQSLILQRDSLKMSERKKERLKRSIKLLNEDIVSLNRDTANLKKLNNYLYNDVSFSVDDYTSRQEYDSIQQSLPENKRDGWLRRKMTYKGFKIKEEFEKQPGNMINKLLNKILHYFPQIFFLSLPLVGLLLKWLYRRKKDYFYVNHVIYLIHLYCAVFLQILLIVLFSKLAEINYFNWIHYLLWGIGIYMLWYLYKSLRNFYHQKRIMSFIKMIILLLGSFFSMLVLFMIFVLLSFFTL